MVYQITVASNLQTECVHKTFLVIIMYTMPSWLATNKLNASKRKELNTSSESMHSWSAALYDTTSSPKYLSKVSLLLS